MKKMIDGQSLLNWVENVHRLTDEPITEEVFVDVIKARIAQIKQAEIWMIFPDTNEEFRYGTYDFTTDLEKCYVNELAMRIRDERGCWIDIREV